MDDKIEVATRVAAAGAATRKSLRDNSDPSKTEAALCRYLRLPPHNARRVCSGGAADVAKLSRAMEAGLDHEKSRRNQTGDDLYADLIAASQESGTLRANADENRITIDQSGKKSDKKAMGDHCICRSRTKPSQQGMPTCRMKNGIWRRLKSLAWHLCAEENGEDACKNDLLWVGAGCARAVGRSLAKIRRRRETHDSTCQRHLGKPEDRRRVMTTPAERTEAVKPDWHDLPTGRGCGLFTQKAAAQMLWPAQSSPTK